MRTTLATFAPAAVVFLAGCAIFQPPPHCIDRGDGMCWFPNPVQIPIKQYKWEVDTADHASARCGYATAWEGASCMMGRLRESGTCHIVSSLTEAQARNTPMNGPLPRFKGAKSVFQHEVEDHCGLGADGIAWLHSDVAVRPLLP